MATQATWRGKISGVLKFNIATADKKVDIF